MTSGLYRYFSLATYAAQKVPGVAAATARHLAFGPRAGQEDCDLRTVIAVAVLQRLSADAELVTVEQIQSLAGKDQALPDDIWGVRANLDLPNGSEIEGIVNEAISKTRTSDIDEKDLPKARYANCLGEWERPRQYKRKIDELSAQERYDQMQEECTDKETVILYFHGGAHYLGNETGHRALVSALAGSVGAKAFSVRYRLAPQEPFPAALTDAVAAYEYLVNPPKTALHRAVDPEKIIIAGDSAGGNLAAALMATLLVSKPRWQVPSGMVLISPWVDLTHSLPSCVHNKTNDYLPEMLGEIKSHKASKAWKADGKQRQFYCDDTMVTHPLVSPMAFDGWKELKSVLIQAGAEERLRDEARYLAQHMSEEGVTVQYDEYRSMPHVFQMISPTSKFAKISMQAMAEYIKAVIHGQSISSRRVLRNSKDEQKQFTKAEFQEYVHESVVQAMSVSREHFGKSPKSVL